ncbi:MAG: hypothetical protein SFU84_13195 [Gemmatimonadales bacterium]|jgi:hypothetical protein|nr:hypothetical protein [Gemmatimonadales bacterium]
MRTASLVFAAFTLAAAPLTAQVRASVLLDIPILGGGQRDRGPVIIDRRDDYRYDDRYDDRYGPRYVVVRDYNARNYGQWKKEFRNWRPVTLYVIGGRYYERPMRGARPISVYHYRNQYFFEPRDRDFYRMRDGRYDDRRYDDRRDNDRRDDRYDDRDDRRDNRDNRPGGRTDERYDNRARRPN